ncbi:MAG: hypothetical protein A2161_11420 [Candidatus Schekmanbacteria bacterium RBG_13_48_7]|uniref:Uncharacterized protein n=1 Tax=Candidatus Schekmanbacteria bacterium RBG_13_48_7 TaxID=1817878 RepID=A0A1F7RWX1_9BACT|nr:MAG: hypothetical protein A2161_11420 [Candidatus Schekmanbacteria bacterium RBG_13_48_7]
MIPRLFLAGLSTAMIFLVFRLCIMLDNKDTAVIASFLTSLYPPFVYFSAGLVTQLPFTFLFLLLLFFWIRFDAHPSVFQGILIGLLSGITLLTRADILFLLPLLFCITFIKHGRKMVMLWIPLCFIIAVSPWVVRNYMVHGKVFLVPPKGGRNLWESNNYKFSNQFAGGEHPEELQLYDSIRKTELEHLKRKDLIEFPKFQDEDEITRDEILMGRVISFIRANPIVYMKLCLIRLKETFRIFPRQLSGLKVKLIALFTDGWILPLSIIGFFLTIKQLSKFWIIHIASIYHVGIHILTTSGISQRIPVMPIFLIYTSIVIRKIWISGIRNNSTGKVNEL